MKIKIFLITFLFSIQAYADEYTVLVGQIVKEVGAAENVWCNNEEYICWNAFYKYKIKMNEVISGENLDDTIIAARYMHAGMIFRSSEKYIIVLKKIGEKDVKEKLKLEYLIEDIISPETRYCVGETFTKYISIKDPNERYKGCIPKSILDSLKKDFLDDMEERITAYLESKDALLAKEEGYTYEKRFGGQVDDNFEYEYCPYMDRDLMEKKCPPAEHEKGDVFEIYQYKVKPGYGKEVIKNLKSDMKKSGINFDKLSMQFKLVKEDGYDVVEWTYKDQFIAL